MSSHIRDHDGTPGGRLSTGIYGTPEPKGHTSSNQALPQAFKADYKPERQGKSKTDAKYPAPENGPQQSQKEFAEARFWDHIAEEMKKTTRDFIHGFVFSLWVKWRQQVRERPQLRLLPPDPQAYFADSSERVKAVLTIPITNDHTVLTRIIEDASKSHFDGFSLLFAFCMTLHRDSVPDQLEKPNGPTPLRLYLNSEKLNGPTLLFRQLQKADDEMRDIWLRFLATKFPAEVRTLMKREAPGEVASVVLYAFLTGDEPLPPPETMKLLFPPGGGRGLACVSTENLSSPGIDSNQDLYNPQPMPRPMTKEQNAAVNVAIELLHRASVYDPDFEATTLSGIDDVDMSSVTDSESSEDRSYVNNHLVNEQDQDVEEEQRERKANEGCGKNGMLQLDEEQRPQAGSNAHSDAGRPDFTNGDFMKANGGEPPSSGTQLDLVQTVFHWLPEAVTHIIQARDAKHLPWGSPYQCRVYSYLEHLMVEDNTGTGVPTASQLQSAIAWADEDEVAHYLKEQIIRRCDSTDAATTLLQIRGTKERALHLDLAEMELRDYTVSEKALNNLLGDMLCFDTILRYVQISWHMCKSSATGNPRSSDSEDKAGAGRRQFQRVFNLLRRLGVRKIFHLVLVDDKVNPHTDCVAENLVSFDIEVFDWDRVDLCSTVIANACPNVRELFLYSSGNNAVLRGWSEKEGLAGLKKLEKLHLTVWRRQESERRTLAYRKAFMERLQQNHSNKTIAITSRVELKPVAGDEDTGLHPEGITANNWLDNMSKFVQFVKTMPKPSSDKGWPGVRVAIIDDGTEIMKSAEFRNNIKDGRSFCTRFDHRRNHHRTAPYYFSHSGHGTVMAQYILRVCPMADLYIARLDCGVSPDSNKPGIHPTIASAAKAINWAIDKEVHIICMSWTMTESGDNELDFAQLRKALARAARKKILMFGAASDQGFMYGEEHNPYPAKSPGVICIGAAEPSGRPHGFAEKDGDFFFPGANFDHPPSMWSDAHRSGSNDRQSEQYVSGSSFATALASGLTALILYCVDVALSCNTAGTGSGEETQPKTFGTSILRTEHRQQLQNHTTLCNVFKAMCRTSSTQGGKVMYIPVAQYFPKTLAECSWREDKGRKKFFVALERIMRPVIDEIDLVGGRRR